MFESLGRAMRAWLLFGLAGATVVLYGCGQRGALYLPDRNARVVTRPAAASGHEATSSLPTGSSAPSSASSAPGG